MKKKLTLNTAFWIFMLGSVFGVIVEMLWCILKNNYIASRQGVIYGPFNPLYGVGAVLMTYFLLPISDKKDRYLFFGSFVIGTLVEYIFHIGQATLFGTYSWDYTDNLLNLNGRVDLFHSICWGILGIFWMRKIYPWLVKKIEIIKPKWNKVLIIILSIFMIYNILISSLAVSRWSERCKGLEASNTIEKYLDKRYPDDFLEIIYPNMKMIINK